MMPKARLVMRRLRDVQPGDLIVGRQNWQTLQSCRKVEAVYQSTSKPGKLVLAYEIPSGPGTGKVRRWPDFYVLVMTNECTCSSIDYCDRCLWLMMRR